MYFDESKVTILIFSLKFLKIQNKILKYLFFFEILIFQRCFLAWN